MFIWFWFGRFGEAILKIMNSKEIERLKNGEKLLAKIATYKAQLENAIKCNHVQITVTGFGEKGALPNKPTSRVIFDIPAHSYGNGEEKYIYHEEAKVFISGFCKKLEAKIGELQKQFDEL